MKHIRTFENFYLSDEEINNEYPGSEEEEEEGMEHEIDHENEFKEEYPGYEDEFSGEEEEEEIMSRHNEYEYEEEEEERPYEYEEEDEFEKFNPLPAVHRSLRHKSKRASNKKWGNSINSVRTLSSKMDNSVKGPRKNKH